ncbi:MAG: HAMP domain-containing histidine kinase [Defluviitaleaceae bacterium]|nr:HAMP domain-containing histidine kinase [Defluviitaleaceae bacterium]
MRSFSKTLIRNFIGMIFVVFLTVYLLFNFLTHDFISEEAHRELVNSLASLEVVASLDVPGIFTGVPIRRLMLNADGIIVGDSGQIISPDISHASEDVAAEFFFMAQYFHENRAVFDSGNMVRASSGRFTYYIKAVEVPFFDDLVVLLYTDITSATLFVRHVNRTLGVILIASGVGSAFISALLSQQVQRAISRLRNHAESIGRGNFTQKVDEFEYKEFAALAQSMNSMADMLHAYENNQKRFFQNVSHELRTPLMSIQGYAEGILEDVLDKNEASEIILSESERMENMVGQVLYVSRLDSGLDVPSISGFSVKNMLYDCAWRVKILMERNKREIIFDFPETECEIKSDEEKLQRAVENILTNCIRHANEKIIVHFSACDEHIEIIISDDGEGFDPADLPHVFERFYKGAKGNSGLGLAICKDIIEKLGGSIRAENIAEGGARFVIKLSAYKICVSDKNN